jgi:hypothetical protein
MITFDAARDQSIKMVIEQIEKESVMKTQLLSLMHKDTSDRVPMPDGDLRDALAIHRLALTASTECFPFPRHCLTGRAGAPGAVNKITIDL